MSTATLVGRLVRIGVLTAALAAMLLACATPAGTEGPEATPQASLAGHPLVGTWVVEITRADLTAAGFTDPGLLNENSGRFTWAFMPDGTWTSVQESLDGAPITNPIVRGTYLIDGSTFIATTTFPPAYVDTGLHYTYTIEGDELRLKLLDPPDPLLPVMTETHAWRRIG